MDKLFRYYFINDAGEYYYQDLSGDLQITPVPTYIEDDPANWDKAQVSFQRGEASHGIFRKSTETLRFQGDAGKIIRAIYYSDPLNGYLKLVVDKQNRDFASANLLYEAWYDCEIDLGSAKDGSMDIEGDVYINARFMELGLPAIIEANRDKTYEISLYPLVADPDLVDIEIKNITLNSKYTWLIPETVDSSGNPDSYIDLGGTLDAFSLTEDEIFDNLKQQSQSHPLSAFDPQQLFLTNANFTAHFTLNCSLLYSTDALFTGTATLQVRHIVIKNASIISNDLVYTGSTIGPGLDSAVANINVSFTRPMLEGEYSALSITFSSGGQNVEWRIQDDGLLSVVGDFFMPASQCAGLRYIDLAKRLLSNMATGGSFGTMPYDVISDILLDTFGEETNYFTRPYYNIVVPAASLRNLPDPKIKTSWTELMKDLEVMFGCGYGIEGNNVRIEPKKYFYRSDITLTDVTINSTVEKSIATDYVYNSIAIGFNDQSVDEINGLQEFACEQKYLCGLKSPSVSGNEFPLTSNYIHGCYSIENIRSYLFRSDSTSIPTDNETCVIEVNFSSGGVYEPNNGIYQDTTFVNGLKYPNDVYNLGHSPKACLIRNLDYIKSYLIDGKVIDFLTATKNAELEYGNTLVTLIEKSDIEITSNGAKIPATSNLYPNIFRIFLPYNFQFQGQMPESLLPLMDEPDSGGYKKYGVMNVDDGSVNLGMFVLDVGITPATDDVYQIRGLCSPDTDISQLIR